MVNLKKENKTMIDEKKIEEAAKEYASERDIFLKCGCHIGFKNGIDWFKKNLWHDAKEQPKFDEKIIIAQNFNGKLSYDFTIQYSEDEYTWEDNVSYYNITKWCYLKDLI